MSFSLALFWFLGITLVKSHREFLQVQQMSERACRCSTSKENTDINYRSSQSHLRDQGNNHLDSSSEWRTPVHIAAVGGNVEQVNDMLGRGAMVVLSAQDGLTALHLATANNRTDVIVVLFQYGASTTHGSNGYKDMVEIFKHIITDINPDLISVSKGVHTVNATGLLARVAVVSNNDSSEETPLNEAVRQGDVELMNYLIRTGANVNAQSAKGWTALHWAVNMGNIPIVVALIEQHNVTPNLISSDFLSPLHLAASNGNADLVKYLLRKGAQVDLSVKDGLTALHMAAANNHTDVLMMLIRNGANINVRTNDGSTVLHLVAATGNVAAAQYILDDRTTRINVRDDNLETPQDISERLGYEVMSQILRQKTAEINWDLLKAAEYGHEGNVTLLLARGAVVNTNDSFGETPFIKAVRQGDMELMNYLIKMGANVNAQSANGWTALHWAVNIGKIHIVDALVEQHDANPNLLSSDFSSPLHLGVLTGRADLVKYLLGRGALVDLPGKDGQTALHLAAVNNHQDIMEIILNAGAGINDRTKNASTALHLSASRGNYKIVEYIMSKDDAILNVKDNYQTMPSILAERRGHQKITALLSKVNNDHLFGDASEGNKEAIKSLILAGGDAEWKDPYGWTPLFYAAYYGHEGVVKCLIKYGASTNVNDVDGRTALRVAAFKGHINIARYLVENGADLNVKDNWGQTPLLAAAADDQTFYMVKSLKELGANINYSDKDGRSPLMIAAANDCFMVVRYLCNNGADVNKTDNKGETSLHKAVVHNNLGIMNFLINKGVNLCAPSARSMNILHLAVSLGNVRIVDRLVKLQEMTNIECPYSPPVVLRTETVLTMYSVTKNITTQPGEGPNTRLLVDMPDKDGLTALHLAAIANHQAIMRLLSQGGSDVNARTSNGSTILHFKAAKGDISAVKVILEKSRDLQVDSTDNYGVTAFHLAAINKNLAIMDALLLAGADVNARMKNGSTALHQAAAFGFVQVAQHILDTRKARMSPKNNKMETPLQLAERGGHAKVIKLLKEKIGDIRTELLLDAAARGFIDDVRSLLMRGADVEGRGKKNSQTALSWAAERGHLNVVKYLVEEEGAQLETTDSEGRTPLIWAAMKGKLEVVKYLVGEKGAQLETKSNGGNTALKMAVYTGRLTVVRYLVEVGAQIENKDDEGRTPLMWAALKGDLEIVRYLVGEKGAQLEAKSKDGNTPLKMAVYKGHFVVVQYLVEKGAQVNTDDNEGETPLIAAAHEGRLSLVKFLVDSGADLNSKDIFGKTALTHAIQRHHPDVASYLRTKGATSDPSQHMSEE